MGSVSSLNPGVENLLQTLSNVNSPVLSSPAAVSALENASPADIVQLSSEANQLQSVDAMFGIPEGSSSPVNSILSTLESSSSSANPSTGTEVAKYEGALQAADTQALFGAWSTGGAAADSTFDLLG